MLIASLHLVKSLYFLIQKAVKLFRSAERFIYKLIPREKQMDNINSRGGIQ